MKLALSLLILSMAAPLFAAETGYRVVHPDGTVEYSDVPVPGGEEIKLREAPTIKMVPAAPSSTTKSPVQQRGEPARVDGTAGGAISIVSPQADQTLWFNEAGITVSVNVSPGLQSEQQIVINLDGKRVASGSGSSFNVGVVYRGSHSLTASVVDSNGKILFSSPSVNFYLRQHSAIKREPESSPPNADSPSDSDEYFP